MKFLHMSSYVHSPWSPAPDHLHFAEQDRPRRAMPQKPRYESLEGLSTVPSDLPLRLMLKDV